MEHEFLEVIQKEYREWTTNSTKILIDLYKGNRQRVGTTAIKRMKSLWEVISVEMKNAGYDYSPANCENRWKVLERNFKKHIDDQKKTGRGRKHFEFFDDMEEVFKSKKNIFPQILLTSNGEIFPANKQFEKEDNPRASDSLNQIESSSVQQSSDIRYESLPTTPSNQNILKESPSPYTPVLSKNQINRKRKRNRQLQESSACSNINNKTIQLQTEKIEYYKSKKKYYDEKGKREDDFLVVAREIRDHLESISSSFGSCS